MDRPFAVTLDVGSSRANKTGSWRVERPVYVDRLPPCNDACPAGENIQGWLYHGEEGGYEEAWRTIMADNPFPSVMGRICYHPCEAECNRARLDQAVGINAVERFLGDQAIAEGWELHVEVAPSGKSVLVIGAGPAGLSAAYHLRRLGHSVTVCEASGAPGGMMMFGIPKYRLPREVLEAEVSRISGFGVEMLFNHKVADVLQEMSEGGFDAAFIAVGAELSHRAYIPAGDSSHVLDALSLLESTNEESPLALGRRVVVYGGGDTAMDAARTARRLGATDPVVVYRRTRERMPAHPIEVQEALEEGVKMRWLSTIKDLKGNKVILERMELDGDGMPQRTGELEELDADSVVLALGQEVDISLVEAIPGVVVSNGAVQVDKTMMTGHPGIFSGGDMVAGERTVTSAIGHGKQAARFIDGWLRGEPYRHVARHELAEFSHLNTWYYSDAPATIAAKLDPIRRQSSFEEVLLGLDESTALFEARRCMSCGNCFECDNCYGMCPDNAVVKLGDHKRYRFDYDYCKGCAICATECPCGAIVMVPEQV